MSLMKPAAIIATTLFSVASAHAGVYVVNNGTELESALANAAFDNAPVIVVHAATENPITTVGLVYEGKSPLSIVGTGQTIQGNSENVIFEVANGADVSVSNLNFTVENQDYSIENQGGEKGIFVNVPEDRTGVVNLSLTNVKVSNVGKYGILVSDCILEDGMDSDHCGAGSGGEGTGSEASVNIKLVNVVVDNVGFGVFDGDGLRVNERGAGDIIFSAVNSVFNHAGADGVELDEGQAGDVTFDVRNVAFENNGAYCVSGGSDDLTYVYDKDPSCIDTEKNELDLDDGFDIDEAGEGSVIGKVINAIAAHNLDQGLDFDEEGEGNGGFNINLVEVEAYDNVGEGVKVSEEGAGDVAVSIKALTVTDNGNDGIEIEQADDGNINVIVNGTTSINNAKKDLKVTQDGLGEGSLKVRGSNIDEIKSDVAEI